MEKEMTFDFICTGGPYSDCTYDYIVDLDPDCTVRQLIDEILKREEWGYIGIYDPKGSFATNIYGNPHCVYRGDKIRFNPLPEKYMDQVIYECKASGGWSRMDYLITLMEVKQ